MGIFRNDGVLAKTTDTVARYVFLMISGYVC